MRTIAAALLAVLVTSGSPVAAGHTATLRAASDYAGFWRNTDSSVRFLQFLDISARDHRTLEIRAWLRCNPLPARATRLDDCMRWGIDRASSQTFDEVEWTHTEDATGERDHRTNLYRNTLTIEQSGRRVMLVITTHINGATWRNTFVRTSRPTTR